MEEMTGRQQRILESVVAEYIATASPVSSQMIERKYELGVSPATIRNEMVELTERGYLAQPHTSAGRVPSDRGYREYVDRATRRMRRRTRLMQLLEEELRELEDEVETARFLAHTIASSTSGLTMAWLSSRDLLWKEGWERVLRQPEFEERERVEGLMKFLGDMERRISVAAESEGVQVYIGKENPFSRVYDFSVILAPVEFAENEKGVLAMIGPKRMPYPRNISLFSSLADPFE